MRILALDVGTTESGYCLMEDYKPLNFGKIPNEDLLNIVKNNKYQVMVYEQFKSYGMPFGDTTIKSIEWNGRYIQVCDDRNIPYYPITRQEEKINICHSPKANDTTIRQALIDRFAKTPSGKGTKKEPDYFYGFGKDMWSAFAIGCTWLDISTCNK